MEPEGSLPHSQVPAADIPLLNFHVSSFHHIFVCILSLASLPAAWDMITALWLSK